jgi:hypothetical protein
VILTSDSLDSVCRKSVPSNIYASILLCFQNSNDVEVREGPCVPRLVPFAIVVSGKQIRFQNTIVMVLLYRGQRMSHSKTFPSTQGLTDAQSGRN